MDNIIHAEKQFREKQIGRLIQGLSNLYECAGNNWSDFKALAEENFQEAIKRLPEFIERARNINGDRAFVEALAGGPNHDWIVPLFNVLGEAYPYLERGEREEILRHSLNYFDGLKYTYSQDHIEKLEDPLLVADILINRWLYWPGLERAKYFLRSGNIKELSQKDPERLASFWVCLAIVWNDESITPLVREWYYKNNENIVERTLYFAAAHTQFYAKGKVEGKEIKDLEPHISHFLNKVYDPALHERIRQKIKEENWVLLPKSM